MSSDNPTPRTITCRRDPTWKYTESFPGPKKGEAKCKFCKTIFHRGTNRFKYHIVDIHDHNGDPCTLAIFEAIR